MNATVKLTSLANLGSQPVAIYGSHGKAYGHARYDASVNRSVLDLPYDQYLKIGPDIAANSTGPFNQWFATFEQKDTPKGEPTDREKELQKQLDAVTTERDAFRAATTAQQEPLDKSNISTANPSAAAPSAPASILDGQVEALRIARDLPRMSDNSIEKAADGSMEKVHRELHPVQAGSPVEDLAADGQTGKHTDRVPIQGTHLEIIEEREKIEEPKDESSLKENVEANLGTRNIENQDAAEASTEIAVDEGKAATGGEAVAVTPGKDGGTGPDEKGVDDLESIATQYRKLRSIAKAEGVSDFEDHKTAADLKAAIEKHRKQKS